MEGNNNNDLFIRKLIRQQQPVKAPDGFTAKVMSRIQAEPALQDKPLITPIGWIALIAGIIIVIIIIFSVDIPFVNQVFSETGIQKISMNIFSQHFISSFTSIFKSIKVTSLTISILGGILVLVLAERFLFRKIRTVQMLII